MNMFFVRGNPILSAVELPDRHIGKMSVETVQMCVSALRRHGCPVEELPLNGKGEPHAGGYANHPMTRWVGECRNNFEWALEHGLSLCAEWELRWPDREQHASLNQLLTIDDRGLCEFIPTLDKLETMPWRHRADKIDTLVAQNRYTEIPLCFGDFVWTDGLSSGKIEDIHTYGRRTVGAYQMYMRHKLKGWEANGKPPVWTNREEPLWWTTDDYIKDLINCVRSLYDDNMCDRAYNQSCASLPWLGAYE
jgi:hypothetical protein